MCGRSGEVLSNSVEISIHQSFYFKIAAQTIFPLFQIISVLINLNKNYFSDKDDAKVANDGIPPSNHIGLLLHPDSPSPRYIPRHLFGTTTTCC